MNRASYKSIHYNNNYRLEEELLMGKKKKHNDGHILYLKDRREADAIFSTMLYNAQHSIFKKGDEYAKDLLQRLMYQTTSQFIQEISSDIRTLALIDHWELEHPALRDRLEDVVIQAVIDGRPGASAREASAVAQMELSKIKFEASERASKSMRKAIAMSEEQLPKESREIIVFKLGE